MILKVGLTGGIATGKTTVAEILVGRGCHLIDADRIARELVSPGRPEWERIVEAFGRGILKADRAIDRDRLSSAVFSSDEKRAVLNAILHPAILEEENRRSREIENRPGDGIVITDAALMIEVGSHTQYERLIVVYCRKDVQLRRLIRRDAITEEQAGERIRSQMPVEEKIKYAHYLVDNSGDLRETERVAIEVHESLRRDLEGKRDGESSIKI